MKRCSSKYWQIPFAKAGSTCWVRIKRLLEDSDNFVFLKVSLTTVSSILCMFSLCIYQGASVRYRSVFDRNRCILWILVKQAEPHNCIPNIHIDFMTNILRRILWFKHNSEFLRSNQFRLAVSSLRCWILAVIWLLQISRLSQMDAEVFHFACWRHHYVV